MYYRGSVSDRFYNSLLLQECGLRLFYLSPWGLKKELHVQAGSLRWRFPVFASHAPDPPGPEMSVVCIFWLKPDTTSLESFPKNAL
jgi:hypothetical protein